MLIFWYVLLQQNLVIFILIYPGILDIMDQEELKKSYKEIQKAATSYMQELPSNSILQAWNETNLTQWRKSVKFRKAACDLIETEMILCRFFNFYFYGVVRAEDCISTILADVIANASTLEHSNIWPNDVFADESSFKPNLSCTKDLLQGTVKSFDNSVSIVPSNTEQTTIEKEPQTQQPLEELKTDYTKEEGEKFKDLIAAEIKDINPNKPETEEVRRLKRLASFLALTLLRTVTKSKYQLHKDFLEKQFRSDLHAVSGWPKELPFYPPCSQCIEACMEALPNSTTTTNIFILLVSEYICCIRNNYNDTSKTKFLYESVLMHTAKHGLGILQLLEHASLVTGLKWDKLLEMTYLNVTAKSWETIKIFFDSYVRKVNFNNIVQYGYNWARIINEGFLRGYTPEDHLPLAGILLGIVEQAKNIETRDMEWIKEHEEKLREMRLYGKVVYDSVKPKLANLCSPSVCILAEPMDIVRKAREILATQDYRQEQKRKQKEEEKMMQHAKKEDAATGLFSIT